MAVQFAARSRQTSLPRPDWWNMLLSGNRGKIARAVRAINAAGQADAYAALLLTTRRRRARRERRLLGLVSLLLPYTERERRSALTALGLLWGALGRELGTALDSKATTFERERAYNALKRRRDQRAVQPLIDALLLGHAPEDWRCIATLGELGDARATEALMRYMALDDAAEAAQETGESGSADTFPHNIDVGIEVGRALHALSARAALQQVQRALQDPRPGRRTSAALVLAGWGDETFIPTLSALLADASPLVREAAALALGELKAAAAYEALQACLMDPEPKVQAAAERAIQQVETAHPRHVLRASKTRQSGQSRYGGTPEAVSKAVTR